MKSVTPRYQYARTLDPNYGPGWVGFSYRDNDVFSKGIAWFTREEYEGIVPSHTFIVQDEKTIIEAAGGKVRVYPIQNYFNDPHIIVFFKKPRNYDKNRAYTIIRRAAAKVDKTYDYSLFFYFISHFLFLDYIEKKFPCLRKRPSFFDSANKFICSEVVADSLNQIPEYSNLFPLSEYHISKIDPFKLFRSEIFNTWRFEENDSDSNITKGSRINPCCGRSIPDPCCNLYGY